MNETTDATLFERPRRTQSLWPVVLIVVVPAVLVVAALYAAQGVGSHPDKLHTYRVAHTRFGDAIVGCGGDLTTKCDGHVGLKFPHETDELLAYFSAGPGQAHVLDQPYFDHLTRDIAGDPPQGTEWTVFECPGARWDV